MLGGAGGPSAAISDRRASGTTGRRARRIAFRRSVSQESLSCSLLQANKAKMWQISTSYPACMKQETHSSPPYARLLEGLRPELPSVAAEIVRDVARPGEDLAALTAATRAAVESMVAALIGAEEFTEDGLSALRSSGARAAREGESLQQLLDRYLTSGWVLWAAATSRSTAAPAALSALGTALLKAGDSAAAALAEGYGGAERQIAARSGAARREFLDELLALPPDDPAAAARIIRRATHLGLAPSDGYRVLVVGMGREIEDEGPEILRVALALDRPSRAGRDGATSMPIIAAKEGRLVLLARAGRPGAAVLDPVLDELAGPRGWIAVEGPAATDLAAVAGSFGAALDALLVAQRLGLRGRLASDDLLLERALLSDERLLRAAVDRELGPILGAPRNGEELLRTVAAYIASRQNLRTAARELGVGVRTVSYRLTRVEELLGRPLAGEIVLRMTTALLARRLLDPDAGGGRRLGPMTSP